jgi:GNAT superfamily N-acetyltransferase
MRKMVQLTFEPAAANSATALAKLHTAVADDLTRKYGRGPWSSRTTEKGVLFGMRHSHVFMAREGPEIVATLGLSTRKPWAIDTSYFTSCGQALYLANMAVLPDRQRRGIGRWCLQQAQRWAREWPADAIRLDAFEEEAGAGEFYAKFGFTEVGRVTYRKTPLIYFELLLATA